MTIDYCWIMQPGQQQEQPSNCHHQEHLHKEFKAVNTQIKKLHKFLMSTNQFCIRSINNLKGFQSKIKCFDTTVCKTDKLSSLICAAEMITEKTVN